MSNTQELSGKVIKVLAPESGNGAKAWAKQNFVIETTGDYPKKVCFQVWNDKCVIPSINSQVTVSYNPESREYNERWYTELSAWKIDVLKAGEVQNPSHNPAKKTEPVKSGINLTSEEDDLPF